MRSVLFVVFVLACALHLYAWYVHPDRPSLTDGQITGWYGGAADQINYLLEARALAAGQLPGTYWDYERSRPKPQPTPGAIRSDYAYGLGYPILAAPFIWVGLERDPFLIPDTIAFGLMICMALLLARRFLGGAAAIVFAGMLAVASPLLPFTVMPWNTTIASIAVLASLLFATSERRDWKVGLVLGAALSLCYAARYTDVAWSVAVVGAGLLGRRRANPRGTTAAAVTIAVILGVTYVAVGWTQQVVFGHFFTNPYHYHLHNGNRGDSLADFRLAQVPRTFSEVFVTAHAGPRSVREPHTSVLRAFPWVVAAPFGLVLLLRRRQPERGILVVAASASVAASVLYLAYWSGTGTNLERYNLRFFVPWFPLWGLLAAVAFSELIWYGGAALKGTPIPADVAVTHRWSRWCLGAAFIPIVLAVIAHITSQAPVRLDLIDRFSEAEKKPTGRTFEVRDERLHGEVKRSISASPPSRLIWNLTVPDHARLTVALGAPEETWSESEAIEFRVGMSDGQRYSDLLVRRVNAHDVAADRGWMPVTIDLEAYSGGRVSVIFNTNRFGPLRAGTAAVPAYWGAPMVSGYVP